MNIDTEVKRDMHNHFLILKKDEKNDNSYGLMMMQNNNIKGLLPFEVRVSDNQNLYYYDITSKQPLSNMFGKGHLKYSQVRNVMIGIINAINLSREFLLDENDFILEPEYIYLGLANNEVNLCHVIGYNRDIQKQMSVVIEYLMNKVDYIDENAVLLTYGLYKLSKDEDCTLDKLYGLLEIREKKENNIDDNNEYNKQHKIENKQENKYQEKYEENYDEKYEEIPEEGYKERLEEKYTEEFSKRQEEKSDWHETRREEKHSKKYEDRQEGINKKGVENKKDNKIGNKKVYKDEKEKSYFNNAANQLEIIKEDISALGNKLTQKKQFNNIPIMNEKFQSEEEITVMSIKAIALTLLSAIVILALIIILWYTGMFYNIEHKIDVTKVFGLFIVVGSLEAYILSKLLSKENRQTKIISKVEYINPIKIKQDKDGELHHMFMNYNENKYDTIQSNDNFSIISNEINHNNSISPDSKLNINIIDNIKNNSSHSYSKTENLNEGLSEETVLLSDFGSSTQYKLYTLSPKDYYDIELIEFPFFIGKLKTNVDYAIENKAISRFHAKIEKEADLFFITDLNTTNGTFVNDIKLEANEKKEIYLDDIIMFADIRYRFQKWND